MKINTQDKTKNRKKLVLSQYKTSIADLQRFKNDVFEKLGNATYEIEDWQTLIFETLRQVNPVASWVKNDMQSISKAANIVTKHFYRTTAKVYLLTDEGPKEEIPKEKTDIEKYSQNVLYIDNLPYEAFTTLEIEVRKDLKELGKLIQWYETDDYIKKYISKNQLPTNHEENIRFDFYLRCIKEQKLVLDFFLNKLKIRALEKCTHNPWTNAIGAWYFSNLFRDFPYKFHFQKKLFDYRIISESDHRVGEFYIEDSYKLEQLYKKNKVLFYRKTLTKERVSIIFNRIFYNLNLAPLKKDRKIIFEELQRLYKGKRWMAFFALALPQVEGLFTDMCNMAFPGSYNNSLPIKVNRMRSLHSLSESYFDYYQYIVPRIRNTFMHTGYDEDFKPKALDLLTDIDHLLQVFNELEHPIIKLKKIHAARKMDEFITYKEYGEYFKLLSELTIQQKNEYKISIEEFERDFLVPNCDADFICEDIARELPKFIQILTTKLEHAINSASMAYDLNSISLKKAKALLNDQQFKKEFEDFTMNISDMEDLTGYALFLSDYDKYLPSIKKETKIVLTQAKTNHWRFIENIYELKKVIDEI